MQAAGQNRAVGEVLQGGLSAGFPLHSCVNPVLPLNRVSHNAAPLASAGGAVFLDAVALNELGFLDPGSDVVRIIAHEAVDFDSAQLSAALSTCNGTLVAACLRGNFATQK